MLSGGHTSSGTCAQSTAHKDSARTAPSRRDQRQRRPRASPKARVGELSQPQPTDLAGRGWPAKGAVSHMERHRQHGGAHATRGLGVPEEEQPLIIKQRVEGRHQPALEPLEQLGDRRLGELLRLKQQRYAHWDLRVEPLHVTHVAELLRSAALCEHQPMRLPL